MSQKGEARNTLRLFLARARLPQLRSVPGMLRVRTRRILQVAVVLLAVGTAAELMWPSRRLPSRPETFHYLSADLPQREVSDFSEYSSALSSRSLFKPATPVDTSPYAKLGVHKAMEPLSFSGMITVKGEKRAVVSVQGKGVQTYGVGDMIGDLKVIKIERDALELSLGEEKGTLRR